MNDKWIYDARGRWWKLGDRRLKLGGVGKNGIVRVIPFGPSPLSPIPTAERMIDSLLINRPSPPSILRLGKDLLQSDGHYNPI